MIELFKKELPIGINAISNNKEVLNIINTFPVEDADTGNNILYTLNGLNTILQNCSEINEVIESLLYYSKGSSGNLISLYLYKILEIISSNKEINKCILEDSYNFLVSSYPHVQEKGTLVETFHLLPLIIESKYTFYRNLYYSTILSIEDTYNRTKKYLPDSGILASLYFFMSILDKEELYSFNFNKNLLNESIKSKKEEHLWCCEVILYTQDYSFKIDPFLKDAKESEKIILNINDKTKFHIHLRDIDLILLFKAFKELNIIPLKIKVDFIY